MFTAPFLSRLFVVFSFDNSEFHTLPCWTSGEMETDGGKCWESDSSLYESYSWINLRLEVETY